MYALGVVRPIVTILLALGLFVSSVEAQRRQTTRRPARRAAPPPAAAAVREAPLMQCPSILGNGLSTQRLYCDVLAGADAASAMRITVPAHTGSATLEFTLHNRHTYSESEVKAGRAFARYLATLQVTTGGGEPVGAAVVVSEFRTEKDLIERIGGGAGPGGAKAVAPTGAERVIMPLPAGVSEVLIAGERLVIERLGGREVITAPGRPLAVVSQVEIEYRPARTPARRR
jgi:hypothetical protein